MAAKRSGGMTAIGVLHLVIGVLAVLGSLAMALSALGIIPGAKPEMMKAGGTTVACFGVVRLAIGALLIAAGIGVLKVAPFGRSLSLLAAALWIAVNLIEPVVLRYPYGLEVVWGSIYSVIVIGLFMKPGWKAAFAATGPPPEAPAAA